MAITRLDNMVLPPDLRSLDEDGITQVFMRQMIESMIKSDKYPRAGEINDFFPLVHKTIISKQRTENVPEDKMLLFVEEDPPEALDTEAITFYIQSRSPGQWGQGSAGTSTHKEVRHHLRKVEEHPDHPGEKLIVSGKYYDNNIRFNIYAKTNKQARRRLLWFTKLMDQYLWYFRMSGYLVVERGTGDRQRVEIPDYGKVTKYPVSFFVRTEDVYYTGTQELKQVALSVDITDE